jgi:hypothetical protein
MGLYWWHFREIPHQTGANRQIKMGIDRFESPFPFLSTFNRLRSIIKTKRDDSVENEDDCYGVDTVG